MNKKLDTPTEDKLIELLFKIVWINDPDRLKRYEEMQEIFQKIKLKLFERIRKETKSS